MSILISDPTDPEAIWRMRLHSREQYEIDQGIYPFNIEKIVALAGGFTYAEFNRKFAEVKEEMVKAEKVRDASKEELDAMDPEDETMWEEYEMVEEELKEAEAALKEKKAAYDKMNPSESSTRRARR